MTTPRRGEVEEVQKTGELRRFALLARSVAGRPVAVLGGETERSYTDGEAIYLAELPEPWLSASLVVQASLLAAGSLEVGVMVRLTGRRMVRLRYTTLEAARAAALVGMAMPARVARLLREVYDGAPPCSAWEALAWAAERRRGIPEAPEWLGIVKPIRVLRRGGAGDGAAPTSSEEDRRGGAIEEALRELDDEEESERSRILELFSAPVCNPLASMIQRFFGMGRAPGRGGGGAELPVGGRAVGPVGANARPILAPSAVTLLPGGEAVGRRYPEWDYRRGAYRRDWCAVAEFDPPNPRPGEQPALLLEEDHRLRHELARLGLSHARRRRQPDGDVIDLTALVELVVGRASGHAGESLVYETRRRTAHDLGVLVLLDATGSTGEPAEGRTVFDEQRLLAARLTVALDQLGDRVASYAFYSRGREAVRFLRVKGFEDHYDHAARRRLASLSPGGYTRLGAAIRHATRVLLDEAGTAMLLLVVIGDGLPYEDGYEHRYAQEDGRRALTEAVTAGVGCVCLGVRTSTEAEVLERVWGAVPHRRLEEVSELRRHVRSLFREALRTAAASRRSTRMEDTLRRAA